MKLPKLTIKHGIFILVLIALAYWMYQADISETERQISLQSTQLINGDCQYFDGFKTCSVSDRYCDKSGTDRPISLGFCNKLSSPRFNRAAIGAACITNTECSGGEICVNLTCEAATGGTEVNLTPETPANATPSYVYVSGMCQTGSQITCASSAECTQGEVCLAKICENPNCPVSWSKAQFDDNLTAEFNQDLQPVRDTLNAQKKYLWYGLFIAVALMFLFLILPKRGG